MPRYLRLQEGWLTVGLLALLLFSVTLSIQQAQWSDGLSILTPITVIGLATGIILAKVQRVPRFLLDLVGLMTGLVVILIAVASINTDTRFLTIQDRVQDLLFRTGRWIDVAIRRDMSDDLLVFVLALAVVAWVLSYSSAYFVFRSRQLWWALVPNGAALLINLSYSPVPLSSYIIIFMFSALLLMIRFNLLIQEERWQYERINYSPGLSWGFLWAGSVVSVVLALAMWYVPATNVNSTLNAAWNKVNQPWVDFQSSMSRLWSQVPGATSIGGYSSFNESFAMGGALNLSDSTALIIKSRVPLYWRAKTYDQYTGIGWKNTAPETLHVLQGASSKLSLEANQQLISEDKARNEITYTVQIAHPKEDVLFAASRPVQLTIPSRLDVSWRTLNDVYSVASTSPSSVPLELRTLLGVLKQAQLELPGMDSSLDPLQRLYTTSTGVVIKQEVDNLSKRGLTVTFDVAPDNGYLIDLRVSGQVPVYDDITSIHSTDMVAPNTRYTVTSLRTDADENQLQTAGIDYEQWVTARYLDLPATVPQRVRDTAENVVAAANAKTPYDKAKAIESYLRKNFKYSTNIQMPPAGMDRVDWFLFTSKEGYCEYYASAMVVMLRAQGIPARMAAGYAPGSPDAKTGDFVIKESSAHTWPEVYFPGYGWIEFEPTPSQGVLARGIQAEPTAQPTAELTPLTSPTANPRDLERNLNDPGPPSSGSGFAGLGTIGGAQVGFGLAGLLLAALVVWLVVLPRTRNGKRVANAVTYYGKMLRWSRLMGIGPALHQTPFEFSETVSREVPGTSLFARSIARAYVKERYSADDASVEDRLTVHKSWEALRSRLWRIFPARQVKRIFRRR